MKSRTGCQYSLLRSDGVVFTTWLWVECAIEWLFGESYIHILDLQRYILFAVIVSDASYLCVDGVPFLPKVKISLPVLIFFFSWYVIELPTLHFGGGLHCMWADSKQSRQVSPVELRAAFMYVNFVHIRAFSHWVMVRRSKTQWKRRGEGFYRGFSSSGRCVFGSLAYPRGLYFCKELCRSLPLAIQSQDCYIILLLSSHYTRGGVTVLWQFQELLWQRRFRDNRGHVINVPSLRRMWLPHRGTSINL